MERSLLEVRNLKKIFYKHKVPLTAVDGISFSLKKGECLGVVGESGCGKSTTARMITHLLEPDGGEILLDGQSVQDIRGRALKELYADIQMVFQSPQDSFDPRHRLGDGVMESLVNRGMRGRDARAKMLRLLSLVELEPEIADRYPHQVSGGQCQRAAIARALAVEPKLIVCDEATSALDVTVQAQIVELLKKLQRDMGLSLLWICHDLALVQHLCDRVLVMYQGRIVEEGTPEQVIGHPREEYTKTLIDAVF